MQVNVFLTALHSFISTALCLIILSSMPFVAAQVRTSPSYELQSDSINIGGGLADSDSYILESTVGEVATGDSDSATYSLRAGYQQMQEVFLSLSGGDDLVLSPALPGITGGEAVGSTTFTVITDSPSGYSLSIQADGAPAMVRGDGPVIADYNPSTTPIPSVGLSTTTAAFGYAPTGNDIVDLFRTDGGLCNAGSQTEVGCYTGLTTSDVIVAQSSGANHPTGATTTLNYELEVTLGTVVSEGAYTATTTVTAMPL